MSENWPACPTCGVALIPEYEERGENCFDCQAHAERDEPGDVATNNPEWARVLGARP